MRRAGHKNRLVHDLARIADAIVVLVILVWVFVVGTVVETIRYAIDVDVLACWKRCVRRKSRLNLRQHPVTGLVARLGANGVAVHGLAIGVAKTKDLSGETPGGADVFLGWCLTVRRLGQSRHAAENCHSSHCRQSI